MTGSSHQDDGRGLQGTPGRNIPVDLEAEALGCGDAACHGGRDSEVAQTAAWLTTGLGRHARIPR